MKTEFELLNNQRLVVEIITDKSKNAETIKTYIVKDDKSIHPDSVTITCTCNGKSVTKVCSIDGYCDCTGDTPKVVCTN
jgi:hypothetical protein